MRQVKKIGGSTTLGIHLFSCFSNNIDCAISQLAHGYFRITIAGFAGSRIFHYKLQGMQLLKELFKMGAIEAFHMNTLIQNIRMLDIPFMYHNPKLKLDSKGKLEIEAIEDRMMDYDMVNAEIFDLVKETGTAQLAVHQFPDEEVEAYIFTRSGRGLLFTTFDEGKCQADNMFKGFKLSKEEYGDIIPQLRSLFGTQAFMDDAYNEIIPN